MTTEVQTSATGTSAVESSASQPASTTGSESTTGGSLSDPASSESQVSAKTSGKGKVGKSSGTQASETVVTETPSQPVYQPNFGYKVNDQEKEIPEYMRGLVTSKEREDEIRDIMTRADGLAVHKEKYQKVSVERDQAVDTLTKLQHASLHDPAKFLEVTGMRGLVKSDPHTFLEAAGFTRDDIIRMAIQLQDFSENPEKAQMFESQRTASRERMSAQAQAQAAQSENQAMQSRMVQMEMSMALNEPSNADVARQFDQRAGQPGAFREKVRQYGDYIYRSTGRVIPPAEAVTAVMNEYRPFLSGQNQIASPAPTQNSVANQVPVIPNVGGSGRTSPAPSKPKNLEELRKRTAERLAEY